MRRSVPLVIAIAALWGCAAARPSADCRPSPGGTLSPQEDASDVPLDPLRTFGPAQVFQVHPREIRAACR